MQSQSIHLPAPHPEICIKGDCNAKAANLRSRLDLLGAIGRRSIAFEYFDLPFLW